MINQSSFKPKDSPLQHYMKLFSGVALTIALFSSVALADAESDRLQKEHSDLLAIQQLRQLQLNDAQATQASLTRQQTDATRQVAASQSDLANANGNFDRAQASLTAANAQFVSAVQDDVHIKEAKAAIDQEIDTGRAAAAAAATKLTNLRDQLTNQRERVSALTADAAQKKAKVTALADSSTALQRSISSTSQAVASTPLILQRLSIQVGTLRGLGRTCTAFEVSASTLKSAYHCIKGLTNEQVRQMDFQSGDGLVRSVTGISGQDDTHDSVILGLSDPDKAYIDLDAFPLLSSAIYLLALSADQSAVALSEACHLLSIDITNGVIPDLSWFKRVGNS